MFYWWYYVASHIISYSINANRVSKGEELKNEATQENQSAINKFIEFIKSGKLEMRIYPNEPIHAKVYIMRKDIY